MKKHSCSRVLLAIQLAVISLLPVLVSAQPGLIAYWPFDSVAGGVYKDATGHGYDAIGTGSGLDLVAGLRGKALNCTGSVFELFASNSQTAFNCSKFSIELLYYSNINPSTDIPYSNTLFTYAYVQSGVRNGYNLDIQSSGRIAFGLSSSTGGAWNTAYSTTVLKAATWYHIVVMYDSANMKVYVNGIPEGSTPYAGTYPRPAVDAHIGCQKRMDISTAYRANGRFDEVKFYNLALTADTIAAHSAALLPVPVLIPYTPSPTYNRRPQLRWFSNKAIATYRIQVSIDPAFSTLFVSVPTADTSYQTTVDLPFGKIWWRVGNDIDSTLRSNPAYFTVLDTTIPLLIPYAPDPTRNRKPLLAWHKVPNSTAYSIQIATAPGFTSPLIADAVTDTFYQVAANLPVSTIYWRVKSSLNTQYSEPDTLTLLNDSIPWLIPMKPDTQFTRRPVFKWYKATGASSYRIQIDSVGNFASPFISTPMSDSLYLPLADLPLGKIYWRVSASTNASLYSAPDTFLIMTGSTAVRKPVFRNTSGLERIQLFALDGRMIENIEVTSKKQAAFSFDNSRYRSGVYICKLTYGKTDIRTSRILIKK